MAEKHYWFRKRTSGKRSGWTPATREGWIATLVFFVVELGGMALLSFFFLNTPRLVWMLGAWCVGCTAAFLAIVFSTGEPLR